MLLCHGTVCGGEVQEGTMPLAWLSAGLNLVNSPITHKKIGPFQCWFLGHWVCVHYRAPWVSPMNSPVKLWVCPTTTTPTGFYTQSFWGFSPLHWESGLPGLSRSPVVPPGLSAGKCGTAQSSSHQLAMSFLQPGFLSLLLLPVWMNVSSLTLVIRLPYSSIFRQFWLVFVFKFVVVLLLVVQGSKLCLPIPPSWPEVEGLFWFILFFGHALEVFFKLFLFSSSALI